MGLALIMFGVSCIIYYIVLILYTKRWTTTFSFFWLASGIMSVGLGILTLYTPIWAQKVILILIGIFGLFFFLIELFICIAMLGSTPKNLDYIIILGAQVRGTQITDALQKRIDRGITYLNKNPNTIAIVSGGKGKGEEISEAEAMATYMLEAGISSGRIIKEEKSTNTRENLKLSQQYFDSSEVKVGIVTNNFHIYRALKLAKVQGYHHTYGIVAGCKPIIFLNYMVREFFAILNMYSQLRKQH